MKKAVNRICTAKEAGTNSCGHYRGSVSLFARFKHLLFLSALLGAIFTVAGCAKDTEPKAIKIGLNVWPGYAHAFIARDMGFFKKNGVDVELILKKDISDSAEMYRDAEVDGVFIPAADVLIFNSEGIGTKIVYIADYSDTGDVIVGKSKYRSLADMKGTTISFEGVNSFSHMFVLKALEKNGLDESNVQFENIPAHDVLAALEEGKIDAGHTWEPVKSQALAKGYKILAKAGDLPGLITDVLAFKSDIIQQRPDDVLAIVKSMLQAREFLHKNKDRALEIMSKAENIRKEELSEGIKGVVQPDLDQNVQAMKPGEETTSLYYSCLSAAEFYLQRGQISKIPDLNAIIEPKFVNQLAKK